MKKVVELGVESRDGGGTVLQSRSGLLRGEERDDLSGRRQIAQLFAETRTSLYRYLVSIGIRPSQADDVIQEAFVRFYQQLEAGTKIKNPRAWLFRVAHNLCVSLQRVERRLVSVPGGLYEGEATGSFGARIDSQSNPEELYLKGERMKRMEAGMSQLTQPQRQCLYLRAEGLRYREIAVVLGIGISSVGEHIQRAIVRLTGEIND